MTKQKVISHRSNSQWNGLAQESLLKMAQLHAEKCELNEAQSIYEDLLRWAKKAKDPKWMMEALAGLLRVAGERLEETTISRLDLELDYVMKSHPRQIPPMVWYCKGAIARFQNQHFLAQRHFHHYLRVMKKQIPSNEEGLARGWMMLATVLQQRGRVSRSLWLAQKLLNRYEAKNFRAVNGTLYLLIGLIHERRQELKSAMKWYQKAHGQFLSEHNWYYHLYVIYGYARIARLQKNFTEARWYLELIEKAASTPDFGVLKREIAKEKTRLNQEAVDLLIDSRKGVIQTRENGQISLRKQYVLLHILEALLNAHEKSGGDFERGLSKAEIIESVWKESYRPEEHDNKLYYNINRLRKIIEPNIRKPQYLLNWKEGYRLAPGLRIQYVGDRGKEHGGEY